MSIYIALPTLLDNQTKYTVMQAFHNADKPEDVYIGLPFMTNSKFYEDHLDFLSIYPNVRHGLFKGIDEGLNIGYGRNKASSFYDNEDYVLQVDSHTFFAPSWDTILVKMYDEALKETNNEKTVLSSYLSRYTHTEEQGRLQFDEGLGKYPFFWFQRWMEMPELPMWTDTEIKRMPEQFRPTDPFIPCVKVNAQFIFGNRHFALSNSLPETTVFFEEELFQTINLVSDGFSLVFPNQYIPLAHLFVNDVHDMDDVDSDDPSWRARNVPDTPKDRENYTKATSKSYSEFINNPDNSEKLKKFQAYTQCHPKYGPYFEWYIPKEYNR